MIHISGVIFWSVWLVGWVACTWLVDRWLGRRGLGEPLADGITAATVSMAWPIVLWWLWLVR